MAGDWIKMRSNLRRHPKVVRMASALNADRLRVVGGLHAVWCLFDEHSEDGCLCGYTPAAIDDEIGWVGFCDQLIAIGWVETDGFDGLTLPEFDTHNGASAKRRAQEADRKRAEREASKDHPQDGGKASASDADKKRTREEERREELSKESRGSTLAGEACKAMRAAGMPDANPSHPKLKKLLEAGITVDELVDAAATAVKSKKPFAYALATAEGRRRDAAVVALPEAVAADPDSKSAIEAEALAKGLGVWDGIEQWPLYKARVRAPASAGLSFGALETMAAQRQGVAA